MGPIFDPEKNPANLAKHELSEGDGVLLDLLSITIEDDSSVGPARCMTIGTNALGTVMVVVWTH
jgi:uncharacterized DUF497 family protein